MTCDAVELQTSSCNPYSFWVRQQDIKKALENEKLKGQRVAFELNGKTSRYKVIETDEEKEFVKCFWKSDIKETWIDVTDFHTKLGSISLSEVSSSISNSNSNHNENSSNKENEQQDENNMDVNVNVHGENRVNALKNQTFRITLL